VHIEHGIGKFFGFTVMHNNDMDREFLVLQYAGGDKLYVPTDQVDRSAAMSAVENNRLHLVV